MSGLVQWKTTIISINMAPNLLEVKVQWVIPALCGCKHSWGPKGHKEVQVRCAVRQRITQLVVTDAVFMKYCKKALLRQI